MEKEYINYGTWETSVKFSQGVSVRNPGRWIFLSGVGAEEDKPRGSVLYPGDFLGQCRHAWQQIRSRLERQGASVNDVVRVVTYVTDVRNLGPNNTCRGEVFGAGPYPPHTFLVLSALALPGMLVEVEVTAVAPK
jgi:enamine deaminase RidA (YjgF/YER057c/UK114 family)